MRKRFEWVSVNSTNFNGGRNAPDRGRTGTRLNIGRPQTRWEDGAEIARGIIDDLEKSSQTHPKVTIGTAIYKLVQRIRARANEADTPSQHA
jgi:hypothetical protein